MSSSATDFSSLSPLVSTTTIKLGTALFNYLATWIMAFLPQDSKRRPQFEMHCWSPTSLRRTSELGSWNIQWLSSVCPPWEGLSICNHLSWAQSACSDTPWCGYLGNKSDTWRDKAVVEWDRSLLNTLNILVREYVGYQKIATVSMSHLYYLVELFCTLRWANQRGC